jgi:protein required for attachment to host cells
MPAQKTWIAVANGSHARVFLAHLGDQRLELVHEMASDEARQRSSEIASDRPGRYRDNGPQQRSAIDPSTDPQRHAKREFAQDVADWLDQAALEGRFDRLVLVAAPGALGNIRSAMSPHSVDRVWRELDKDLTNLDVQALEGRFDELARY